MSFKVFKNTFEKGIVKDISPNAHPGSALRDVRNMRLLSGGDNNLALTNVEGNEVAALLPEGYQPIGWAGYNGVLYIVSVLTTQVDGLAVSTGQGQIGCYPSPDYLGEQGSMVDAYRPFQNFRENEYAGAYGDFTTTAFDFSHHYPAEIEIQPSYDGTVNVIINDRKSPLRIINSRFSLLPGGRYKIVDRTGAMDSNLYQRVNFQTTIRLTQRSNRILQLDFKGTSSGGVLPGGNYRYFFRFATAEDNFTEVVAESGLVSVFRGTTPQGIIGSKAGLATDRSVRFELSNLDPTFGFVKVSFIYYAGDNLSVPAAYTLTENLRINGNVLSFTHTGFENKQGISIDSLNVSYRRIDSVQSICQLQNRLFMAGIKEKKIDLEALRRFALRITIEENKTHLPYPGLDDLDQKVVQEGKVPGTDGYNQAYWNPMNIYHRLAYFEREAYPVGIVYIFPDGSLSPVCPTQGADRLTNPGVAYAAEPGSLAGDWDKNPDSPSYTANAHGIYRFSERGGKNLTAQGLAVTGLSLNLSAIDQAPEGTIGCFFVRGERKPDRIAQGYMVPTLQIPLNDNREEPLFGFYAGANDSNNRFIPLLSALIEAHEEKSPKGDAVYGIVPFRINRLVGSKLYFSQDHFGFLSNDIATSRPVISQVLAGRQRFSLDLESYVTGNFELPDLTYNGAMHFYSLFRPTALATTTKKRVNAQVEFIPTSIGAPSFLRFCSKAKVWPRHRDGQNLKLDITFNDYVGVKLDANLEKSWVEALIPNYVYPNDGRMTPPDDTYGTQHVGYLATVFPEGGPRSLETLTQIYRPETTEYQAISPRFYWRAGITAEATAANSWKEQRDAAGRVNLFGGDCFASIGYRRLFFQTDPYQADKEYSKSHAGYTVQLVHDSPHNPALRHNDESNAADLIKSANGRTFAPYQVQGTVTADKYGAGSKWREYRLPETSAYNAGYSDTYSRKKYLAEDAGALYTERSYDCEVAHSEQFVPSAFVNGYRTVLPLSRQDYPRHYGPIVKITARGNYLYVYYENGIERLPVNERIQTGRDGAGAIFVESSGVLPVVPGPVTAEFGCQHPFSVVQTDNYDYCIDARRGKILQLQGDQVNKISDLVINSFLKPRLSPLINQPIVIGQRDIRAGWDRAFDEILFTVYGPQGDNFTVVYNETQRVFASFYSLVPAMYASVNDRLFTFPAHADKANRIYRHNAAGKYGVWYEQETGCALSWVVNPESESDKVYQWVELVSNALFPNFLTLRVDEESGLPDQVENERQQHMLTRHNTRYQRSKITIPLPRIRDRRQDGVLHSGARLRNKAVELSLDYQTTRLLTLTSILTFYRENYL